MNKATLMVLVTLSLAACGQHTAIFEHYSDTPIAEDCAYKSIDSLRVYDFVEQKDGEIAFFNKSVGGRLFYAAPAPFTTYGMELTAARTLGPDLELVSAQLADRINEQCHGRL